jgi:putative MATE family efflux protein
VTAPAPSLNRQIAALAVPALGALLAEPAFLLADAAIVGHLGTAQLAGVAVASVVLTTIVGLAIFLAYGTTAQVARSLGAGDRSAALAHGVDGLYLALGLGVLIGAVAFPAAPWLVRVLGAVPLEAGFGTSYLRWSLLGLPGMLLVLAATGVLRGLQDTRTPLVVAVTGAVVNVGLNVLLVFGFGWGVAGSAIGTALSQTGMAVALAVVVWRGARRFRARLRPHLRGIGGAGRSGVPLLVRTATLRVAIIVTTVVAAGQGTASLAAHQVVMSIWNFLALGLDAVAIAAQALTGKALGEGDAAAARALTRRMLAWGVAAGVVIGVVVLLVHAVAGTAFSPDPAVRATVGAVLLVLAAAQPVSGWVFVLDGVLIGAGDAPYLAWAGLVNLAVYLPAAWAVAQFAAGGTAGLVWLWIAYAGAYMAARAVTLGLRYRGDRWLVTGAFRKPARR